MIVSLRKNAYTLVNAQLYKRHCLQVTTQKVRFMLLRDIIPKENRPLHIIFIISIQNERNTLQKVDKQ